MLFLNYIPPKIVMSRKNTTPSKGKESSKQHLMFHFIGSLPSNIFEDLWYVYGHFSEKYPVEKPLKTPLPNL